MLQIYICQKEFILDKNVSILCLMVAFYNQYNFALNKTVFKNNITIFLETFFYIKK